MQSLSSGDASNSRASYGFYAIMVGRVSPHPKYGRFTISNAVVEIFAGLNTATDMDEVITRKRDSDLVGRTVPSITLVHKDGVKRNRVCWTSAAGSCDTPGDLKNKQIRFWPQTTLQELIDITFMRTSLQVNCFIAKFQICLSLVVHLNLFDTHRIAMNWFIQKSRETCF